MEILFSFFNKHSHEIFCWSWALGIVSVCMIFLLIIDRYWTQAYSEGYEQGFNDGFKSVDR